MTKRRSALIIGLGRFGSAASERLSLLGWDVAGVDADAAAVQQMQECLPHVVQLNAADEAALATLGVADFDVCIVSSGGSVEGSLLLVLNLQELGAQSIVAKAASSHHARILKRLGVQHIVFPERDAGTRLADRLQSPHLLWERPVGPERHVAIVRVPASRDGSALADWPALQRDSVAILDHLTADGEPLPDDRTSMQEGEIFIILGNLTDVLALGE